MPRSTGFAEADASDDFLRARRSAARHRLARRFERGAADIDVILPFEEVVAALGRVSEVSIGLQVVELESIVGTVSRGGAADFDRDFRPTSSRVRARWERIALALRRGESLPPVQLYRVGDVHFVRDGHHRVSVARALGWSSIDASVIEVRTRIGADRELTLADLPLKGHERLFRERVPRPPGMRARVVLSDPWRYGELAEGVEAWGFRVMQDRGGAWLTREATASEWFLLEFEPVVAMIDEAGLRVDGWTDADAYFHVGAERYRVQRTHEWSPALLARLRDDRG